MEMAFDSAVSRFIARLAVGFSIFPVACLTAAATTDLARDSQPAATVPASGLVPNSATAVKIAVAVWEPIFGKDVVASEAPYSATLQQGVWKVEGSLKPGIPGGTASIWIDKMSGKILGVSHGQ